MTTVFTFAYEKASKKIIMARSDTYTSNVTPVTAQQYLETHCTINDLDVSNYVARELPFDKKREVLIHKHIYNEATNTIEVDPNWVEPTPAPAPAPEPTPTV